MYDTMCLFFFLKKRKCFSDQTLEPGFKTYIVCTPVIEEKKN